MKTKLPVTGLPVTACLLAVALLMSLLVQRVSAAPTLDQANTAFATGDYRAAIKQYEEILRRDGFSAPVLFDLGNAYYRDSQFGAAILSYERAQILAPRDGEIATNLHLAREKAGVPEPKINEAERIAGLLSPNTLAWIGFISLAITCLAIGLLRMSVRLAYLKAVAAVGILTMLAVIISFAVRWPEFDRGIVIATKAPALIAPASTAAESFTLKAGEPVTIAKGYGQFILARTQDGRAGWVNEKYVGRVFAAGSSVEG